MKHGRHSVSSPLSKQLLVKGFLPLIVVMIIALAINEFFYFKSQLQSESQKLALLTQQIATKVEASNQLAVMAANTMAQAQQSGMFGQRETSSDYAKAVLIDNPQFTGAYFGYEPNADGLDGQSQNTSIDDPKAAWFDVNGRFLPYWFRSPRDNQIIEVEPLKDMTTSLYYQGVKQRFLDTNEQSALITEPYEYYGKLIVEHSAPIVIDGRFKGIAGVDRSLDDVLGLLNQARESNDVDVFLLSASGRFIASTTLLNEQIRTKPVSETVYRSVVFDLTSDPESNVTLVDDPVDSKPYYFVAAKIATGDWMVIVRKDAQLISRPLWQTLGWLLGSSLLGIAFASFVLNRSLRSMKERIESAVVKVSYLSRGQLPPGDFTHKDDVANKDEVSAIARALDQVIDYYVEIDESCKKMAEGDFAVEVSPKSENDILSNSINALALKRKQAEQAILLARQQAEDANEAKGRFLANMSHEIRTPMNAILGLSRLCLASDIQGKPRNYLEKIHSSANLLLQIINDILDFSKIEAGKLELERTPFVLADMFDQLADATKVLANEKGLFPKFDLPDKNIVVWGDPLRLGQVLLNLLNNAIKFTQSGDIVIQVTSEDCGARRVRLRFNVKDTGIGISEQQQKNLFNAFGQADESTSRKFGGSGLGLVISDTLVSRMGGKLDVKSELGKGTTVSFNVIFDRAMLSDVKHKRLPEELDHMHILWTDGDPENRRIAMQQLNRIGVANTLVRNGREAIQALSEPNIRFDLLIVESEMVDMSAQHLVEHIKTDDGNALLPVVIIANSLEQAADITVENNIIALLNRPVTDSDLFDILVNLVSSQSGGAMKKSWAIDEVAELKGKRVLLVEDNPVNQLIAQDLLEQLGVSVITADNGKVALEQLNQETVDAVLMDLQMPVMDGLEATSIIRQNTQFNTLPIIAMTANAMEAQKSECLRMGMNDFIAKPIDFALFKQVLSRWLASSKKASMSAAPVDDDQSSSSSRISLVHLDAQDALERAGHIKSKLLRLLDIFHQHHCDDGDKILQALERNDSETAAQIAHSLAGVAAYIGAHKLAQYSITSEKQLSSEHGALDSELADSLLAEIEAVKREVGQFQSFLSQSGSDDSEETYLNTLDDTKSNVAPRTVLLVDDDRLQLDVLLDFFQSKYRVYTAGDGKTCLEKARQHNPDLIILDMALPLMNGNQICEHLKADSKTKDIPIIFISSKSSIESDCLAMGGVDFILKPLNKEVVLARVERHIETRRDAQMRMQEAGVDGLTSFANYDLFVRLATTEMLRCARENKPVTLVDITISNFDELVVSYDSQQVNRIVVCVAESIASTFGRPGDIIARLAQDGFACMLPNVNEADCQMLVKRLNDNVIDTIKRQSLASAAVVVEYKCSTCAGESLTALSLDAFMDNAKPVSFE